jgi:RNA polymerase sigma factor (sigma-70 family)
MDRTDEPQLPPTQTLQGTRTTDGSESGPRQTPPSATGEHEAFRALVDAHRPELLRYARRQLGGRSELAEDVLQDAFLNAYRHLAAGSKPQNARAWLYAIVHNATINVARAPQPAVSLEAYHSVAGGPMPSEAIEQREWLEWLMGAIGALGTATLTSGLLLAGQAGHSVAIAASRRQAVSAHARAHHHTGGGGARAPNTGRSPAARLHHEARRATAECASGRRLDRHLRVAALQYAASHLETTLLEYTDCEQILRMRARRIAGARGHRHAPPGPGENAGGRHAERDRHAAR